MRTTPVPTYGGPVFGHHRYAFLVVGLLPLAPHAQGIIRNDKGERVCFVPVS